MTSVMQKMWTESQNPVIKIEFTVLHRMSRNLSNFGLFNQDWVSKCKSKRVMDYYL